MGNEESALVEKGYVATEDKDKFVIATKKDDTFFIKKIPLEKIRQCASALTSEIGILMRISHPHIVSIKEHFRAQRQNIYYVVMDYCQGGNLDAKIREGSSVPPAYKVLSCFVEICMALRTIHEKGLLHKDLKTESIFLTEFGIVCLGGFGKIHENAIKSANSGLVEKINYLAPEVFTGGTYDAKSDIWSLGCILFELCTQKPAFTAETTIKLMPKIIEGPYPSLPDDFPAELCELLNDILVEDPQSRPTVSEILARPIIIDCLSTKCKTTVADLQDKLKNLRDLADHLAGVHKGATLGSLAGGVIGAAGGITSIVGLVLAPFTLGASLAVAGVGVGMGAFGGVTAAASNITNMVNQSSDRKAIRSTIKEFEQKINAVVLWLQEIGNSLETLRNSCDSFDTLDDDSTFTAENLKRVGFRAGRGLSGIAELVRLVQVANIGRIATQTSRAVRVATGVLSGLFIAVDLFFIAMDAKELVHISDAEAQDQSPIRSELMIFVQSVREAADHLEEVLNELAPITSSIPSLEYEWELE